MPYANTSRPAFMPEMGSVVPAIRTDPLRIVAPIRETGRYVQLFYTIFEDLEEISGS